MKTDGYIDPSPIRVEFGDDDLDALIVVARADVVTVSPACTRCCGVRPDIVLPRPKLRALVGESKARLAEFVRLEARRQSRDSLVIPERAAIAIRRTRERWDRRPTPRLAELLAMERGATWL